MAAGGAAGAPEVVCRRSIDGAWNVLPYNTAVLDRPTLARLKVKNRQFLCCLSIEHTKEQFAVVVFLQAEPNEDRRPGTRDPESEREGTTQRSLRISSNPISCHAPTHVRDPHPSTHYSTSMAKTDPKVKKRARLWSDAERVERMRPDWRPIAWQLQLASAAETGL
ncbi:MAG TPA: hypothetical protein VGP76_11355 [Planctomycetaceae bacterium]|nr:hypothetical protein [Planctomycetaceae bacterium]